MRLLGGIARSVLPSGRSAHEGKQRQCGLHFLGFS